MTSHMNINWGAVGESNRREFNVAARWNMKNRPEDKISRNVYSTLAKPYKEPAKAQLHRAEVMRASPAAATGGSAMKYAMQQRHDTASSGGSRQMKENSSNAGVDSTPTEKVRLGSSPTVETYDGAVMKTQPTATTDGGPSSCSTRRKHCRRKHKKDCPKHLLNEARRRKTALESGMEAPYSPVLDDECAIEDRPGIKETKNIPAREQAVMISLPAPNHIGKWGYSTANFLTGVYNEKAGQWARRNDVEHPDFGKLERENDQANKKHHTVKAERKALKNSGKTSAPHINSMNPKDQLVKLEEEIQRGDPLLGPNKLLRDELDTTHYRRKYEMKTHMEKMRLMGKALLRD